LTTLERSCSTSGT